MSFSLLNFSEGPTGCQNDKITFRKPHRRFGGASEHFSGPLFLEVFFDVGEDRFPDQEFRAMIEPFPGIGFDGLLVDRADAILGSDQVDVAVDHPYFGLLGRDLASQVPRHLQVAIDGLADRYPLVSDRRVHPFVERDVHLLDRPLNTQEIALRFGAGCRYADGEPDTIDHIA